MAIRVQIAGGDTLEFPDGTDPAVIDRTVKTHVVHTQRLAAAQSGLKQELANDPTSGNGDLDIAGAGSALTDMGLGIRQMLAKVFGDKEKQAKLEQEAIEKRRIDAPLLNTTAGKVGQFVGEAAPALLVPGGAELEGAGILARLGVSAGKAAATGAASAALEPVAGDESRLENMGRGAALGGALGAAGKGIGLAVAKGAARPLDAVIDRAEELGFNPSIAQSTGNPLLKDMEASAQSNPISRFLTGLGSAKDQKTLNTIAAKAIGQDGVDNVGPQVLQAAKAAHTKVFDALADDVVRPISKEDAQTAVQLLKARFADAPGVTDALDSNPLVVDLLDKAGTDNLTGRYLSNLQSRLRVAAKAQYTNQNGNRELGSALKELRNWADDALLTGKDEATTKAVLDTRAQYRIRKTLEKSGVLRNDGSGDVNGKVLANVLNQTDKQGYLYGANKSDLYDAARYAATLNKVPNSGTATRQGSIVMPLVNAAGLGIAKLATGTGGLARTLGRYGPSSAQVAIPLSAELAQLMQDPSLLQDHALLDSAQAVKRLRTKRPQAMTRDQIAALLAGGANAN